jgi:hypothetical protein
MYGYTKSMRDAVLFFLKTTSPPTPPFSAAPQIKVNMVGARLRAKAAAPNFSSNKSQSSLAIIAHMFYFAKGSGVGAKAFTFSPLACLAREGGTSILSSET